MSDEDVDRWLQILVEKEILFCRQTGNTYEHVFRHALLYQAAYAMLAPKEEVSGHYLAGHFLEKQGERDAIVLADHFEKGDKPERAVCWLRIAAHQAMKVDDLGAALDSVGRGVRLGAQGDDLAELKVVESEARFWRGDYVLAERAARESQQCTDPKLALRALAALMDALGMQAKYVEIEQLGLPLEERPRQPELLNAWLDCKAGLASYLAAAGRYEARESTLVLLEQEWDKLDPILIGRAESMRGHLARAEGRPAEALERIRRAQECFDRAGHRRASIEALGNHGIQLLELGLLEEAESDIRSLWALAERMGLNHLLGGTLYMLSNILAYRGCLDEARNFGEKALAWTIEMNDGHFRRFALLYLIVIENLAANYQGAEQHARAAIEMLAAEPSLQPFARALLARALLGQGLIAEAVLQASDAQAQLEAMGSVQDGEPTIRLALVECLVASSDVAAATRLAHQAADKIRKQADTIDNPEWRHSFLTCIPEHCRILELEQQLESAGRH
jgi:tetratricopeptide (TPR) repeat protein